MSAATVLHGDCLAVLRDMPDESVHAVVTDPPYGLSNTDPAHVVETLTRWAAGERDYVPTGKGFMGKAWDAFVPPPAVWDECLRVLKPGGHLLAFAGSRTFDLMTLSIRFAGFDIRDSIAWLYGSGFPKSMNVAKAIAGTQMGHGGNSGAIRRATLGEEYSPSGVRGNRDGVTRRSDTGMQGRELPLTQDARAWQGWGTALKPAFEPVVVARKPLAGTVAANVLAHGTGALNIDATRVAHASEADRAESVNKNRHAQFGTAPGGNAVYGDYSMVKVKDYDGSRGRWPTNVLLDGHAADALDEQARYFPTFRYQAKAPTRERPAYEREDGTRVAHPTVKPVDLMRWLVRLVTPPGGTVLDPFAGSGTTIEAALAEGFDVTGIERDADYLPLIQQRVDRVSAAAEGGLW